MSDAPLSKHDETLVGLVFSLRATAMLQLGKLKNPLTDTLERDLDQARVTIDIVEMLRVKCRAETPAEILRLLDATVTDLQMNYLDELRKERAATEAAGPGQAEGAAARPPGGESQETLGAEQGPHREEA